MNWAIVIKILLRCRTLLCSFVASFGFGLLLVQVNLCQKLLFLHHLIHNMTTDCSLNYKFNTWKFQAQTWGEHVVYRNCFRHSEQFLYTTCSPHVLQKEELLTKIYLYHMALLLEICSKVAWFRIKIFRYVNNLGIWKMLLSKSVGISTKKSTNLSVQNEETIDFHNPSHFNKCPTLW